MDTRTTTGEEQPVPEVIKFKVSAFLKSRLPLKKPCPKFVASLKDKCYNCGEKPNGEKLFN